MHVVNQRPIEKIWIERKGAHSAKLRHFGRLEYKETSR